MFARCVGKGCTVECVLSLFLLEKLRSRVSPMTVRMYFYVNFLFSKFD